MKGKEDKHIRAFRQSKLKQGETVECHLDGWIGEMMGTGDKTQHNGQFVLTTERACFYRKGLLGEVFETIPLSKVTSIEVLSKMGYRVLRLHTSHDELAFKTFEPKALFDQLYDRLEVVRNGLTSNPAVPVASTESVIDQIKKLSELREAGILTDDEFSTKKAELLTRL